MFKVKDDECLNVDLPQEQGAPNISQTAIRYVIFMSQSFSLVEYPASVRNASDLVWKQIAFHVAFKTR